MRHLLHRQLRALAFIALSILVAACASEPRVRSDFDKGVNFSAYRTYGFPATVGTDRGGYSTLVTGYFKEAVRREMTARGYEFAEQSPDLLVNFYSESRSKTEVYAHPMSSFSMMFGYAPLPYRRYGAPYYYPYGWYAPWPLFDPHVDVVNYQAGTLKLDVVDANRQQSIWEARVEERMREDDLNSPRNFIDNIVTAMFRKFPQSQASSGR